MRRTFFAALVIGWVILSSISFGATYGGGAGTATNPYQIWTPQQMNTIGANPADWGKCFKLMADIDMSAYTGTQYIIIGNSTPFTGTFDGNGHKISNLTYTTTASVNDAGLFGYIVNATIKNLGIENVNISTKGQMAGGLAGSHSEGTISNCYSTGTVSSSYAAGGLVGSSYSGTIVDCYSEGFVEADQYAGGLVGFQQCDIINCRSASTVTSTNFAGGLAGFQNTGSINNCYGLGSIKSDSVAGGLVGYQNQNAITIDCYSTASVAGVFQAGGLIGQANGQVTNCHTQNNVTSRSNSSFSQVGGLVGLSSGNITNCSSRGSVHLFYASTVSNTGGLVGLQNGGTINSCCSTASVLSSSSTFASVGGLVGDHGAQRGTIINSYSMGSVSASASYYTYVGGLMGSTMGTINNCFSSGFCSILAGSGTPRNGGLVGVNSRGGIISNSFWDTQTSGMTVGVGSGSSSGVTGKTTAQMKTQSTFTGWDFTNIWYMTGYPSLKWEINPLQAQIDAASNGATIVVQPGFYQGRLYFKGKNITLTSTNPQDPNIVASTVIQGLGSGSVITFVGTETSACVLSGLTITGGNSLTSGGGVIGNDCTATIQNCRFYENTATTGAGGGMWGVHGLIENCVVYNNSALWGGGIAKSNGIIRNCLVFGNQSANSTGLNNCDGTIQNCTVVSDQTAPLLRFCDGIIQNCILYTQGPVFDTCTATVSYSCYPGATGTGNISFDPMFVNPANGDYHLLPDSPCIDAGDPTSDYSNEPTPNGSRIDMGAYGNTPEAAGSRDGLIPLGFVTIQKIRTGRTTFEYELAVIVRNSNAFDMTSVQMQLKDWDAAVLSVSDDSIAIDTIPAGATVTSTDTFKIVVDRSMLIDSSKLAWILTYYVPAYGTEVQQTASMLLSAIGFPFPDGDITKDGKVNLEDFVIMSQQWDDAPGSPSADIASPWGHVGIEDLIYLAENWLTEM